MLLQQILLVVASLSDTSFADDTQYQWQLDGQNVSDVSNGKTNFI